VSSYPTPPPFTRPALAPGLLGAIVLMSGLALLDSPGAYLWIRYGVSILALIVCVFGWQARQWWWILPLGAIAVVWNPVWVITLSGQGWAAGQFIAALVFIAAGIVIKVRNPESKAARPRR